MKALRSDLPATGETTMSEGAMAASSYHGRRDGAVEHQLAVRFATTGVGLEGPDLDVEPPALAFALDTDQMIAGATVLAAGSGRGRGHSHHRNGPLRAGDARDLATMIMAVQDRLAADTANHRLEGSGVGQMLEARLVEQWRMMDQHDAAKPFTCRVAEQPLGARDLRRPEIAGRQQRRLRDPGREPDQRDAVAAPQAREDGQALRRRLALARHRSRPQAK